MSLAKTTIVKATDDQAEQVLERYNHPRLERMTTLNAASDRVWRGVKGLLVGLSAGTLFWVLMLFVNLVADVFGYTEKYSEPSVTHTVCRPNYMEPLYSGRTCEEETYGGSTHEHDFMDMTTDSPYHRAIHGSDYDEENVTAATDGTLLWIPVWWLLGAGAIGGLAYGSRNEVRRLWLRRSDQRAALVYDEFVAAARIRCVEIPNAYKAYWQRVQDERKRARRAAGVVETLPVIGSTFTATEPFRDYKSVLADHPHVLIELEFFMDAISDNRTYGSVRTECESRVIGRLHSLADELYGSVQSQKYEQEAHNEGVQRMLEVTPE